MKFLSAACICLLLAPALAADQKAEPRFERGHPLAIDAAYQNYGGTVWWQSLPIKDVTAKFIRLKFSRLANPLHEPATLVIRDHDGNQLQRLPLEQLDPVQPLVTMRFPVQEVTATVEAPAKPVKLRLRLSEYFTDSGANPKPLSTQLDQHPWFGLDEIGAAPALRERARGVANLLFTSDMASCSGFLVARDRIMTNTHCIASSSAFRLDGKTCSDVLIQFDYLSDKAPPVSLHCRDAKSYPALDIAVLRLAAQDVPKLAGRPVARFADGNAPLPSNAELIHHPAGLPMKLSRDCAIVDRDTPVKNLRHSCNTGGGSSGSPLFNANGRVVGVQQEGFPDISLREFNDRSNKGEKFYNIAVDVKRLEPVLKELDK